MAFRLSEKEARDLGLKIPERPQRKYHNRPDRLDGIHFDSHLELRRYAYLCHVEMAGELEALQVHPRFSLFSGILGGECLSKVGLYEADFYYRDSRGEVVEDCKGVVLPLYELKRRIFQANYPALVFMEVRLWRNQWRSQQLQVSDVTS